MYNSVPSLLVVWPEADLPILDLPRIVLKSIQKYFIYFAKTVKYAIRTVS